MQRFISSYGIFGSQGAHTYFVSVFEIENCALGSRTNRKTLCGVRRKLSKTKSTLKPPSASSEKFPFATFPTNNSEKMFGIRMDKLNKSEEKKAAKMKLSTKRKKHKKKNIDGSRKTRTFCSETETQMSNESSANHNWNMKIVNFRESKVEQRTANKPSNGNRK